jgi:hypothetical protein
MLATMGADRSGPWSAARPSTEERNAFGTPVTGTELRALRRLQREQAPGRYVFMSERGAPMSAVAFRRMLAAWTNGQDALWDPPAHDAAFNRVQVCQPGRGYPVAATLPRP